MKARQVVIVVGMLVGGLTTAAIDDGLGTGLTVVFLLVAPAIAFAMPLRGVDPLARIVLALTAAVVINALVAEVMVATNTWSIEGGVAAVGVISAVIWLTTSATSALSVASADTRREIVANTQNDRKDVTS